ncbi:MAG TPA: hypothetical protein DD727_08165, partial [Clostridiales bacterium]|nr:hypothetical protein [Clostridiales bacterium]
GTAEEDEGTAEEDEGMVYGRDEIDKMSGSVHMSDYIRMTGLVLSRLTTADISLLAGYLQGGLTREEMDLAVRMCYQRFSLEEVAEIKSYYTRYTAR